MGVKEQFTQVQINEWVKCSQDPVYFIKTYCKIVHVDRGMLLGAGQGTRSGHRTNMCSCRWQGGGCSR